MQRKIDLAFSHRQRPANITDVAVCGSLRDDAQQFAGKEWTSVSAEDWIDFGDAYYGLAPEAFIYFLPSILVLSLNRPETELFVADALIMALDTSADPELWSEWFSDRFGLLTSAELGVLKDWVVFYLAGAERGEGSGFARVLDTLTMLELALQR